MPPRSSWRCKRRGFSYLEGYAYGAYTGWIFFGDGPSRRGRCATTSTSLTTTA